MWMHRPRRARSDWLGQQMPGYELWFHPIHRAQQTLSFRCDAHGRVDLDELSERGRTEYFYARTVVGVEFMPPALHLIGASDLGRIRGKRQGSWKRRRSRRAGHQALP